MKYFIFILCFFILSCGKIGKQPIPIEPEKTDSQYKLELIDSGLFLDVGQNYMYRYGYYIYALERKGLLLESDAIDFCNSANHLILPDGQSGLIRHPDAKTLWPDSFLMTRDDYFGALIGAYEIHKHFNYCDSFLKYLYDNMHNGKSLSLTNDIWSPWHQRCFDRAYGDCGNNALIDFGYYVAGAIPVCDKPEKDTSDKLLDQICIRIASEFCPTIWTEKADEYCHKKVDFNNALNIYYKDDPLGKLLQNTL